MPEVSFNLTWSTDGDTVTFTVKHENGEFSHSHTVNRKSYYGYDMLRMFECEIMGRIHKLLPPVFPQVGTVAEWQEMAIVKNLPVELVPTLTPD